MTQNTEYNRIPNKSNPSKQPEDAPTKEASADKKLPMSNAVQGLVITEDKPSLVRRVTRLVLGEGGIKGVRDHIVVNILIPGGKQIADSAITAFKDSLLWHNQKPGNGGSYNGYNSGGNWGTSYTGYTNANQGGYPGATNYRAAYKGNPQYQQQPIGPTESTYGVKDWLIPGDITKAQSVLNELNAYVMRFGRVSVGEYYDLLGQPRDYAALTYGWTDLSQAMIVAGRGGYIIKFPPVSNF